MAKVDILIGTTLGGAEYVADEIAEQLTLFGHQPTLHLQAKLSELDDSSLWLVVSSTHGAGDLPDNLHPLFNEIMDNKPNLNTVKFAICAIGDSSYDTFCQGPKKLEQQLLISGSSSIVDKIEIDVQQDPVPEEPALAWLKQWIIKI